jgi:hypothetical protein
MVAEKYGGYMGDPEITGEHEIDIGLRKRPLREPFIRGPLLERELAAVAGLPGKALAVWLIIRLRVDLNRGRPATLPRDSLKRWGIGQDAKADALRRLEQAGLIQIERRTGYMLKVKIVKPIRRREK